MQSTSENIYQRKGKLLRTFNNKSFGTFNLQHRFKTGVEQLVGKALNYLA